MTLTAPMNVASSADDPTPSSILQKTKSCWNANILADVVVLCSSRASNANLTGRLMLHARNRVTVEARPPKVSPVFGKLGYKAIGTGNRRIVKESHNIQCVGYRSARLVICLRTVVY